MHYSLVMVGAHDGTKAHKLITRSAAAGKVLLIEPVPFLFRRLTARYADCPAIGLRDHAIAASDGEVEFTAPKETANSLATWGDQLGSLVASHAVAHHPGFAEHIEVITVKARSFATLLDAENISTIELLFTDTEGMDAELLPTFPFSRTTPNRIIFEFKHADGFMRVGPKLARLLDFLDGCGYRISVLDSENMIATHRSVTTRVPISNFLG